MFLRFIVASETDSPWWSTGVFTVVREIRDEDRLESFQVELVNEAFAWFNEHLPCPPFEDRLGTGAWSQSAVAWFLAEARTPISRMWDLVAVLEDHGMAVRLIRTDRPGRVVYRDEFQVVAETPSSKR